jgi:hypothetical protein
MQKVTLALLVLFFGVPLSNAFADTNGTGFTTPTQISSSGNNSTIPQIIVSGNNVYLGWIDDTAGKFGAMLAKSNDGGTSFGKIVDLGNADAGAPDNIRIAEYHGSVYSVWQSFFENKSSIVFAKSKDSGTTFSSPTQISDPSKDSAFPQISAYGNNIYVAWIDRSANDVTNIFFTKSTDGGATFGKPFAITNYNGNSGIPKIYSNSTNVYLMWEDNSLKNYDVFLSTSSDSGNTFGAPVNISSNPGDSGAPQMLVNGDSIYATWMDQSTGNFEIMFAKSTDGGKTFTTPVNVSAGAQDSGYPQFDVTGNNIYITWTHGETDKNYDIFFAKSTDGGATFSMPMNLSNSVGASGWPQIAAEGNIYVSWVDNTSGHFDIYIAKSTGDGNSFESPVKVNYNKNNSWNNKMAVSSNTVYLTWSESGNNNSDVMFSKSTTFVPEFGPVASLVLIFSIIPIIIISQRSVLKTRI